MKNQAARESKLNYFLEDASFKNMLAKLHKEINFLLDNHSVQEEGTFSFSHYIMKDALNTIFGKKIVLWLLVIFFEVSFFLALLISPLYSVVLIIFIFLIIGLLFYSHAKNSINHKVKEIILSSTCMHLGLSYKQRPQKFQYLDFLDTGLLPPFARAEIEGSSFHNDPKKISYYEDFIYGTYNDIPIEIAEFVGLEGKISRSIDRFFNGDNAVFGVNSKRNPPPSYILCRFQIPRVVGVGRIRIENCQGLIDPFVSSFSDGLEIINLESLNFTQKFTVYAENQIKSRYILTPLFMERFLELNQYFLGDRIEAAVDQNELLICITSRRDHFEVHPAVIRSRDYSYIINVIDDLYNILKITEILKLDNQTRI
ncbi:DUF3137 domain-containing protein [Paremcibacter congregatus]|uniref:DUF3137 domain-containing protein n=1 Tax=Paremcibacter congregatus TaxID=2043170 RepID=UPI0030EE7E62|tara:strand:- start:2922 stop:4031 length:1110 start_codon:yes stop_codon:yes gene_type:complete